MSGAVMGWIALLGSTSRLVALLGALALGLAVYVGVIWILKVPELKSILRAFLRRVNK